MFCFNYLNGDLLYNGKLLFFIMACSYCYSVKFVYIGELMGLLLESLKALLTKDPSYKDLLIIWEFLY